VVDFLIAEGQTIAAVDSRLQPADIERFKDRFPDVPVFLGDFDANVLSSARQLVLSPGVSMQEPAIETALAGGVKISSDVEIFCQQVTAPVVAVTGSNGKSTVVTLLANMIQKSGFTAGLAGNIGTPVLDLLAKEDPDFYVLELSSFQLETLQSLNSIASLVLNISPDHMDRYQSLEDYAAAKKRIFSGDGQMILNSDDPLVMAMVQANRTTVCYGLSDSIENKFSVRDLKNEMYLCHGNDKLISTSALKIHGVHNVSNALGALALGDAIGLPMCSMLEVLKEFSGLPHRCQWLANIKGVDWYNDSKGTNVGASCAAIEGLAKKQQQLILIGGGDGKQADFAPLARTIQAHVQIVILIGKDAPLIDKALAVDTDRYFATSMEAAVNIAAGLAQQGDLVLLSPACGSVDMYQDYQHRGEMFGQAVRALMEGLQ
jgi:UDP-N-acetylmuramoylalanine--D-glutamate ligase